MAADDARTGADVPKPVHQDITAISTISIHGLTLSDTKVSLSRAESFPSFQYDDCEPQICDDPSWDPLPIPQNLAHLDLRLTDRINEGRIGLVYGVDVLGSRDRALKLPSKLCVKIFKPNSARTAAREYWFYEQLARSGRRAGSVAARCFGFFTASLSDLVDENGLQLTADRILPWEEALIDDRGRPYPENPVKRAARKAALATKRDILFGDDEFYWKSQEGDTFTERPSPWARWKSSPTQPLLAILLFERLGEPLTRFSNALERSEALKDIQELVVDLGRTGIMHCDIRLPNILRVPEGTKPPMCSCHKCRHWWRFVDFDQGVKTDSSALGRYFAITIPVMTVANLSWDI